MKKNERGSTLIEAVVALGAVFMIVAALSIVIVNSINNSRYVKDQNLANKYAQQGMEFARKLASDDVNLFADYSGVYAYDEDSLSLTPGESAIVNVGNSHIRNIDFRNDEEPCINTNDPSSPGLDLKKVTVTVSWSSGRCPSDERFCHQTIQVSCIPYEKNELSQP